MAVLCRRQGLFKDSGQDLRRARSFYAEKLDLKPVEVRPGGIHYRCGNSEFAPFKSAGRLPKFTRGRMGIDEFEETNANGWRKTPADQAS